MDNNAKTGAVRSADTDLFSWSTLPWIALIGVARTGGEGKGKYGAYNYKRGMPADQYLDHSFHHLALHKCGDRSQPNLEHAAWGILAAIESLLLYPELNAPNEIGPGLTLTPEMLAFMAEQAPILAAKRASGEMDNAGNWRLADLPDVKKILDSRAALSIKDKPFADPDDDPLTLEMVEFLKNGEKLDERLINPNLTDEDLTEARSRIARESKTESEHFAATEALDAAIDGGLDWYDYEPPSAYMLAKANETPKLAEIFRDGKQFTGDIEGFEELLEKKLEVTALDMEQFEAAKLKAYTSVERAKRLKTPLSEASECEAKLASGWHVDIDKAGTIETRCFLRQDDGTMKLVGHLVTFPDGSTLNRLTELAVTNNVTKETLEQIRLHKVLEKDKMQFDNLVREIEAIDARALVPV